MTAMIGLPLGLTVGLLLGRGWRQWLLVGILWYASLAWQTGYIADVGRTAFGGKSGLDTVHWWVYWALQPMLLLVALALVWLGSLVRVAVIGQFRRRTTTRARS